MAEPVGVTGVLAALSVTSDLTRGRPPGEAMRACLLAGELARRAGLDLPSRQDVHYATLMRFAGCAATSHEAATAFGGDDIAVRHGGDSIDPTRPLEAVRFLAGLGQGVERLRVLARAPRVAGIVQETARADCEVGADLTDRVRLPQGVRRGVLCAFERHDGKGSPAGLAGEEVAEAARFAAVGYAAVMFDAVGGPLLATQTLIRWQGRALDPAVVAFFLDSPGELLALSNPDDAYAAVVEAEPGPRRFFRNDAHLEETLAGFGDAADLKAPFFQGHSGAVAALARSASMSATAAGFEPTLAYRAGLVHDLGRVAIPTGVWERPGPLRPEEWELVRLHPYHSGRILARSPVLAPLGAIASRHHERMDGSGYPAGVGARELEPTARLLAAADAWQTLREARPHRPALGPLEASRAMSAMALDRDAVRAVLRAADAPRASFPPLPVHLTERELEVLRLLAGGRTKRQIAGDLYISHATVHTHTVHIYSKCEVSTRAGLAMFAMRHGLASTGPRAECSVDRTVDARRGRRFLASRCQHQPQENREHTMTTDTLSATAASDMDAVRAGFAAVGAGDLPTFAGGFHPDATWNHRNPDRLGGVKDGVDAIVDFLVQSMQLTAGTLRPVPLTVMADGAGCVAVVVRITGTRPDGRTFDDHQVMLFAIESGLVRSVDQYIGDPTAVTAFWA